MGAISVANGLLTTVIDTEHELSQQTGVGVYVLNVDTSPLQAGDTMEIRISTRCRATDTMQLAYVDTFSGAQAVPNWYSIPIPIVSGGMIMCYIEQTAGVSRFIPWNLIRA